MSEINPNHPTTAALRDQWHKVLFILMRQIGLDEFVITETDIQLLYSETLAITAQELPDGLHVRLMKMEAAEQLAREHGWLPT